MAFGVPGGSTNMTYFVLCGGGLTAAVVYVSIRSGYRRWFVSPHFHRVCTAVSWCYTWIFQVRNLNLCYSVGKRKSLRSFVLIFVICVVFLYMSRDQLPCGAAALRFTSLSWFRQRNSVISRCYILIMHFLLQMPILMPPQRDSCLNWSLMTANIDLTQFFSNFFSHFISKAEKVHASQPVFFKSVVKHKQIHVKFHINRGACHQCSSIIKLIYFPFKENHFHLVVHVRSEVPIPEYENL